MNSFHLPSGYLYLRILAGTPAILIKVSRDFIQAPHQ
jgi:hypothetical protein